MNVYIHAIKRHAALILALCLALCGQAHAAALPNGVETIESGAFQGDSSLTEISIPASVTSVGEEAFADCANLSVIRVYNASAVLEENSLGRIGEKRLIRGYYGSTAEKYAIQYGFEFGYVHEQVMRVLRWMADRIDEKTPYSDYDCIGFARAAYKNALGIKIAERCPEMYSFKGGLFLGKDQIKQLQPGDVLCFTDDGCWTKPDFSFTNPKYCTHVGVYVGPLTMRMKNEDGEYEDMMFSVGTFFESSNGAGKTRVNKKFDLNNPREYYNRNFMGAVRILY